MDVGGRWRLAINGGRGWIWTGGIQRTLSGGGRWEVETGCGCSWGRQWMCVDVEVGCGWEVGLDVSG